MFESASVRSGARRCKPCDVRCALGVVRRNTPRRALDPYDEHSRCRKVSRLEVILLFWDEMDDWVAAARHLLRNLT